MPDKNDKAIATFPYIRKDADGNVLSVQNVHLVIVKEKEVAGKNEAPVLQTYILPLVGILVAAAILVWLMLKIKPGSKTDRIINRFEGFNAFFGTGKHED